jgi:hypothetical protein
MANLCLAALGKLRGLLLAPDGIGRRAYAIAIRDGVRPPRISNPNVVMRHVGPDLSDAGEIVVYPALYLYCERLENRLERKFSAFSGRVEVVAEVRVSGESIASIDGDAARLCEAVMSVLADNRGQWTPELSFDGKLDVRMRPVEPGGAHFRQTARIEIELIGCA